MTCRYIDDCRVFSYVRENRVREDFESAYCKGPLKDSCERYRLQTQGRAVPLDLLPDGTAIRV